MRELITYMCYCHSKSLLVKFVTKNHNHTRVLILKDDIQKNSIGLRINSF